MQRRDGLGTGRALTAPRTGGKNEQGPGQRGVYLRGVVTMRVGSPSDTDRMR